MSHASRQIPLSTIGKAVRLYRNLHTGKWSVQAREKRVSTKTGRVYKTWVVVGHSSQVVLGNVTYEVSQCGQARARADNQRNVHAWLRGTLIWFGTGPQLMVDNARRLTYNPFKDDGFMLKQSGEPAPNSIRAYATADGGVYLSLAKNVPPSQSSTEVA